MSWIELTPFNVRTLKVLCLFFQRPLTTAQHGAGLQEVRLWRVPLPFYSCRKQATICTPCLGAWQRELCLCSHSLPIPTWSRAQARGQWQISSMIAASGSWGWRICYLMWTAHPCEVNELVKTPFSSPAKIIYWALPGARGCRSVPSG